MNSQIKLLIRIISIINCIYALIDDDGGPELCEIVKKYTEPKSLKLTQIGIILTLISTLISFTNNLRLISIFVTNTLAIEFIVVLGYWSLYYINPCLVNMKELVEIGYKSPFLKSISQHLLPLIFIIYEFMINTCFRKDLFLLVPIFIIFFTISFKSARIKNGQWQYGILNTNNVFLTGIIMVEFCILAIVCVEFMFIFKKKIKKLIK